MKAISSHYCSFVDEARRDKRLDTFQMTVSTIITNQTLKQNPIYVSLIRHISGSCAPGLRVNLGLTLRVNPRPMNEIRVNPNPPEGQPFSFSFAAAVAALACFAVSG